MRHLSDLMDTYIERGNAIIKGNHLDSPDVMPIQNKLKVLECMKRITPVAILLGQDPYPQFGVATGVAFANKEFFGMSPSLQVIEDSVMKSGESGEFDPTLEFWIEQGIIPINVFWTVELNKPLSHAGLWITFTKGLLRDLSVECPGMFYMAFGSIAFKFCDSLINPGKVLYEYHPSFYARTKTAMPPWIWSVMKDFVWENFETKLKLTK